jgi:hypothetical protein
VYTKSNPIPLNPELPSGLVYKVQIGAFKSPVAGEAFKEFSPITGENAANGWIRYTAGMFNSFENADRAKNTIRTAGYKDAFVVAYYNGKRISVAEARALISGGNINTTAGVNVAGISPQGQSAFQTNSDVAGVSSNIGSTANLSVSANASASGSSSGVFSNVVLTEDLPIKEVPPGVAPYREINKLSGLLYTVQVGVYARPVQPAQLYNLQPLFVETTKNNLLRYTTGVFNELNRAVEAKNKIVALGIKDAFVTAYYNGNKISVAEAKVIEGQGSGVFLKTALMNKVSDGYSPAVNTSNNVSDKVNVSTTNAVTVAEIPLENKTLNNLVFKIQIGAYKEMIPVEVAGQFLKVAYLQVEYVTNDQGLTIYSVGKLTDYASANKVKAEVIEKSGITDAFIAPYYNGKKISVAEAMELLKK